jgi:hypothetical protein
VLGAALRAVRTGGWEQQEIVTMLRYCLVVLAGAVAAGPAAAASWADGLFEELTKDFGSVPRGPALQHHFRVSNNTGQPVVIAGVRVSCGCVSAQALKTILAPGEDTHIVAVMDTTRFIGVKSVTIYVTFSRPAYEEVRIWVQANARNDFSVAPESLAFGTQKRASTPVESVTITFYGDGATRISDVRSESNYIQPTLRELRREPSEVAYQLTTRIRADAPVGKWYSDIWLRTADPAAPPIRVPLTVEIESALSISPDPVAMGPVRLQEESERRVIVRGARPFKITRVMGTDAEILVRDNTPYPKPVHVLTVRLKGTRVGDVNRTLRVLTDLPDDNKIDFQVSGMVTP